MPHDIQFHNTQCHTTTKTQHIITHNSTIHTATSDNKPQFQPTHRNATAHSSSCSSLFSWNISKHWSDLKCSSVTMDHAEDFLLTGNWSEQWSEVKQEVGTFLQFVALCLLHLHWLSHWQITEAEIPQYSAQLTMPHTTQCHTTQHCMPQYTPQLTRPHNKTQHCMSQYTTQHAIPNNTLRYTTQCHIMPHNTTASHKTQYNTVWHNTPFYTAHNAKQYTMPHNTMPHNTAKNATIYNTTHYSTIYITPPNAKQQTKPYIQHTTQYTTSL